MKKMLFILMALAIATPAMASTITFGTPVTSVSGQVTIPWTADAGVAGISLNVNVTGGTASSVTVNPTSFFDVFLDSAYTQEVGGDYVYKTGIPTASQGVAGQLALPQSVFSICAGGLDDSATKSDGIDDAPVSGSIVIVGTPGAAVAITADTVRGGIVAYAGAMTVATLPINTTIGSAVVETITTPTVTKTTAAPAIAGRVNAVRVETFVASGATSSAGHTLEYQFNWGDGSALVWGAATQTHTFASATTLAWTANVTVQARCIADTGVTSAVSAAIAETGEAVKSTATFYAVWAQFNRPNCWAYKRNCHGDADGVQQPAGKGGVPPAHWTGSPDLGILSSAWQKADAALTSTTICADFDRVQQPAGKGGVPPAHRVGSPDLGLLSTYWQKADATNTVCPSTDYNYWTN